MGSGSAAPEAVRVVGHDLLTGLGDLLTPGALGLMFLGVAVGTFMGMLPGLGVSLVLSLMLPFLYHMSLVPAVAMMLAVQASSYYSASITAILLNTPGAPESFPTTLDGFPMAQRGEAGRALAISAASTWAGGWIAAVILIGLLQVVGPIISVFHPPEFVGIIVLALVLIGGTQQNVRTSKVLLAGAIGLMLSFVGSDPVTGVARFTFGLTPLLSGLNVVPFALGVFALTQMVVMFGRGEAVTTVPRESLSGQFGRQIRWGLRDTVRSRVHVVRSAVVASLLGLIPGIGGFSANFISYGLGRQLSRDGKKFGTGVPAGIASAEGSSLAKEVGSLVPAVALGLPSGIGMVIFIAALEILGVQPGPTLLHARPALPYTMMWVMAISGLVSCSLGLALTPWISRVTTVRGPVLFPYILALAVIGSFAAVTDFTGVVELVVFTGIGLVLRKLDYSVAALAIGLVLGRTFADNVHLTQTIYGWRFFSRAPLADVFFAGTVVLLVVTALRGRKSPGAGGQAAAAAAAGPPAAHPILEPAADAVITAVSVAYTVAALRYPPDAGRLPAIVGAIAAAVAFSRLARWLLETTRRGGSLQVAPTVAGTTIPSVLAEAPVRLPLTVSARHGPAAGAATAAPVGPAATHPGGEVAVSSGGEHPRARRRTEVTREVAALGWVLGTVVATYLLGFKVGIPVAAAAYALAGVRWPNVWARVSFAVTTAAVTFVIAYGSMSLFHFTFAGRLLGG